MCGHVSGRSSAPRHASTGHGMGNVLAVYARNPHRFEQTRHAPCGCIRRGIRRSYHSCRSNPFQAGPSLTTTIHCCRSNPYCQIRSTPIRTDAAKPPRSPRRHPGPSLPDAALPIRSCPRRASPTLCCHSNPAPNHALPIRCDTSRCCHPQHPTPFLSAAADPDRTPPSYQALPLLRLLGRARLRLGLLRCLLGHRCEVRARGPTDAVDVLQPRGPELLELLGA